VACPCPPTVSKTAVHISITERTNAADCRTTDSATPSNSSKCTSNQSNLAKAASNPWPGEIGHPVLSNTMLLGAPPKTGRRSVQRFLQDSGSSTNRQSDRYTERHTTLLEHFISRFESIRFVVRIDSNLFVL